MPDFVYAFDWYDGPRVGLTSYGGAYYYYESQWVDVYERVEDWFKLCPVSAETAAAELERWQLWKAYEATFKEGAVGQEYHPYLLADQERGRQLERLLEKQLVIDEATCLYARAAFQPAKDSAATAEMEVQWTLLATSPIAT